MSDANKTQIGGNHYKAVGGADQQHWDRVWGLRLDYFQGQITKYVERWKLKNGLQDLEKARHFLAKYIELRNSKTEMLVEDVGVRATRLKLDYYQGAIIDHVEQCELNAATEKLERYIALSKLAEVYQRAADDGVIYDLEQERANKAAIATAAKFMSSAKVKQYVEYTYEGGTAEWDLYRCIYCKLEIKVPIYDTPEHMCDRKPAA